MLENSAENACKNETINKPDSAPPKPYSSSPAKKTKILTTESSLIECFSRYLCLKMDSRIS